MKKLLCLLAFMWVVPLSGCTKGVMEIKRLFPQQLSAEFSKAGIDVDDYGVILTVGDHLALAGVDSEGWNQQWKAFFKTANDPSKEEIMDFLEEKLTKAGFVGRLVFVKCADPGRCDQTGQITVRHSSRKFLSRS